LFDNKSAVEKKRDMHCHTLQETHERREGKRYLSSTTYESNNTTQQLLN